MNGIVRCGGAIVGGAIAGTLLGNTTGIFTITTPGMAVGVVAVVVLLSILGDAIEADEKVSE